AVAVASASPVYTLPGVAGTLTSASPRSGSTRGLHARIWPVIEEKMKAAGALVVPLLSTKPVVGLKTWPVGSEGPPGRVTRTVGTLVAVVLPAGDVYRVAVSVPLFADHSGVVGPSASPHGLTRSGST